MKNFKISINSGATWTEAEAGACLAEVLADAGHPLSLYCHGRGVCGKCLVLVARGEAGHPDEAEARILARRGSPAGGRLACRVRVSGPLEIVIPEASRLPVLVAVPDAPASSRRSVPLDPPLRKYAVRPDPPSLERQDSDLDRLLAALPEEAWEPSTAALAGLAAEARPGGDAPVLTAVVHGRRLLDVERGDTTGRQLGLAVDLGTTTAAAELVDLETGRTIASGAALNAQARFGADVVSRITAARFDPAAARGLREAAWETVDGLLARLLELSGRPAEDVYETVVAGNTAMVLLALGLSVASLTEAPFQPLLLSLPPLPAREAGSAARASGLVSFAPGIGSFVGGDISAGLVAADLEAGPRRLLYVDLGTNGEIVLKNGSDLACASTAAGPAFEGMSLSRGMMAGPGAIHAVRLSTGGRLELGVVGGGSPAGLCGSGIIDLLAIALDRGELDPSGAVRSPSGMIEAAPCLALDRRDVREIQLAAAAIKTGMKLLLDRAGLAAAGLDEVWVAGAFGSTLDVRRAVRLGLLPDIPPDGIRFLGNASLAGARLLLLSSAERDRCASLARRIRHVPLAGAAFQAAFVESLPFGPWR